ELFKVVFIGLGIDVPVKVLEIVPGHVLAVLAELDREAMERAGVEAGQEPLDDELGAQIKTGHLADDFGAKVFLRRAHRRVPQYSCKSNVPSGAKKPRSSI